MRRNLNPMSQYVLGSVEEKAILSNDYGKNSRVIESKKYDLATLYLEGWAYVLMEGSYDKVKFWSIDSFMMKDERKIIEIADPYLRISAKGNNNQINLILTLS